MAKAEQVYAIVNAAAKQAYGEMAVTVIDTSTMISLGTKVLRSDEDKDLFTNALMDVIGRTIFSVRSIPDKEDGVTKKPFDFGLILRKIYVDTPEAQVNGSWKIGEEGYEPRYAPIMKPTVSEKLFDSLATFEYGITIPDNQWQTAFHNAEEMAGLINSIFTQRENRIKEAKNLLVKLTRATAMAHVLKNGNKVTRVNLLTGYNAATGSDLKKAQALTSKDFLRWANMTISEYSDRLADDTRSRLFNQEKYLRYTPKDLQVLTVLSKYAKASGFYLESDTYHNTLVKMPMYNEVSYWQGSGDSDLSFDTDSGINISLGGDAGTVAQSGIVAILHDWEMLGVMIDKERTVAQRNNLDEYTDYVYKSNRGYFIDLSENAVVFYIADTDITSYSNEILTQNMQAIGIPVSSIEQLMNTGKNKTSARGKV